MRQVADPALGADFVKAGVPGTGFQRSAGAGLVIWEAFYASVYWGLSTPVYNAVLKRHWYHAWWFYAHSIVRGGVDMVHVGIEIAPAD